VKFDNGRQLDLVPDPVFNTRAACSSLPPDATSVRAIVQALFAATKLHNTRCCSGRLRPHDGRDNPDRSQRRLEQTLASLRDASPALERVAPLAGLLSSFENRGIAFAGIFSGNLYIFRLGVPSRAQHHFGKRQLPLPAQSQ